MLYIEHRVQTALEYKQYKQICKQYKSEHTYH